MLPVILIAQELNFCALLQSSAHVPNSYLVLGVETVSVTDSPLLNFTLQSPLVSPFPFESTDLLQFITPEPPLLVIFPAPEIFTFNVYCWTEELLPLEAELETEDKLLEDDDEPEESPGVVNDFKSPETAFPFEKPESSYAA